MAGSREKKPDPHKTCKECGSVLARRRLVGGRYEDMGCFLRRKFCDRSCMAASMEGVIKVLNPKNSRRQAAKQSSGRCCECLTTTGMLSVHHRDENPLNNYTENLITLCQSCHMKGHWRDWKSARGEVACQVCGKKVKCKGMCQKHYQRLKKYGDPLLTKVGFGGQNKGIRLVRELGIRD